MPDWTPDEVDEWFGGDMDEAREHMAYEREKAKQDELQRVRLEAARAVSLMEGMAKEGYDLTRLMEVQRIVEDIGGTHDEEPDREPSADQEKAWDEQYDGTSLGA